MSTEWVLFGLFVLAMAVVSALLCGVEPRQLRERVKQEMGLARSRLTRGTPAGSGAPTQPTPAPTQAKAQTTDGPPRKVPVLRRETRAERKERNRANHTPPEWINTDRPARTRAEQGTQVTKDGPVGPAAARARRRAAARREREEASRG